jgi:DNA-directed RNA polymerase specialized sigma24 family protein
MNEVTPKPQGPGQAPVDAESTFQLLARAHSGDSAALDVLFARYLKPLQHWASGRLPDWARASADTNDLVQDTLLNTFRRIGSFEPRREGAFQAYLRQVVMNRIREEIRRTRTRPGTETLERYEAALARLAPGEREAIIGRVELRQSYAELAKHLEKPSPDAARMAVARALARLAEEMGR